MNGEKTRGLGGAGRLRVGRLVRMVGRRPIPRLSPSPRPGCKPYVCFPVFRTRTRTRTPTRTPCSDSGRVHLLLRETSSAGWFVRKRRLRFEVTAGARVCFDGSTNVTREVLAARSMERRRVLRNANAKMRMRTNECLRIASLVIVLSVSRVGSIFLPNASAKA